MSELGSKAPVRAPVRRPSGLPSIADRLLRCREPTVWANCGSVDTYQVSAASAIGYNQRGSALERAGADLLRAFCAPALADVGATLTRYSSGLASCVLRAVAAPARTDVAATLTRYSPALARCGQQAAAWSDGHRSTEDKQ
jgi:hypothetical protein